MDKSNALYEYNIHLEFVVMLCIIVVLGLYTIMYVIFILGRQWVYQTCTEFGYYQTSNYQKQPFGSNIPLQYVYIYIYIYIH